MSSCVADALALAESIVSTSQGRVVSSRMLEFVSLVRPFTLNGGVHLDRRYLYFVQNPAPGLSTDPRRQDIPAVLAPLVEGGIIGGST